MCAGVNKDAAEKGYIHHSGLQKAGLLNSAVQQSGPVGTG